MWAAETTARSRLYTAQPMPSPLALVLGNERIGVDTHVLSEADAVVALPMRGFKNSLNVATARAPSSFGRPCGSGSSGVGALGDRTYKIAFGIPGRTSLVDSSPSLPQPPGRRAKDCRRFYYSVIPPVAKTARQDHASF